MSAQGFRGGLGESRIAFSKLSFKRLNMSGRSADACVFVKTITPWFNMAKRAFQHVLHTSVLFP